MIGRESDSNESIACVCVCVSTNHANITGRSGHAYFINGAYDAIKGEMHDLRPVYIHRVAIPKGYKDVAG